MSVKRGWRLFVSIFQLSVGVMAILAFIMLGSCGENVTRWIGTLILAALFAVLGIIGIVDYKSKR